MGDGNSSLLSLSLVVECLGSGGDYLKRISMDNKYILRQVKSRYRMK